MSLPAPNDQPRAAGIRWLLICDLDGTLIPSEWSDDLKQTRRRFAQLVENSPDLTLAYATGRDFHLALEGIRNHGLPEPRSLICEVGSTLYHRGGESFRPDARYEALMESASGSGFAEQVFGLMGGIPGVEPQEDAKQGRFKVSFYVRREVCGPELLGRVRESLTPILDRIGVVFSIDAADLGGLLDIVPTGVSKASAAHYLRKRLSLETEQVVYAGDSGNDTAALLAGFNAILVGNAPEALRAELKERVAVEGPAERLYFSRAAYMAGVLEGCERFGLV